MGLVCRCRPQPDVQKEDCLSHHLLGEGPRGMELVNHSILPKQGQELRQVREGSLALVGLDLIGHRIPLLEAPLDGHLIRNHPAVGMGDLDRLRLVLQLQHAVLELLEQGLRQNDTQGFGELRIVGILLRPQGGQHTALLLHLQENAEAFARPQCR